MVESKLSFGIIVLACIVFLSGVQFYNDIVSVSLDERFKSSTYDLLMDIEYNEATKDAVPEGSGEELNRVALKSRNAMIRETDTTATAERINGVYAKREYEDREYKLNSASQVKYSIEDASKDTMEMEERSSKRLVAESLSDVSNDVKAEEMHSVERVPIMKKGGRVVEEAVGNETPLLHREVDEVSIMSRDDQKTSVKTELAEESSFSHATQAPTHKKHMIPYTIVGRVSRAKSVPNRNKQENKREEVAVVQELVPVLSTKADLGVSTQKPVQREKGVYRVVDRVSHIYGNSESKKSDHSEGAAIVREFVPKVQNSTSLSSSIQPPENQKREASERSDHSFHPRDELVIEKLRSPVNSISESSTVSARGTSGESESAKQSSDSRQPKQIPPAARSTGKKTTIGKTHNVSLRTFKNQLRPAQKEAPAPEAPAAAHQGSIWDVSSRYVHLKDKNGKHREFFESEDVAMLARTIVTRLSGPPADSQGVLVFKALPTAGFGNNIRVISGLMLFSLVFNRKFRYIWPSYDRATEGEVRGLSYSTGECNATIRIQFEKIEFKRISFTARYYYCHQMPSSYVYDRLLSNPYLKADLVDDISCFLLRDEKNRMILKQYGFVFDDVHYERQIERQMRKVILSPTSDVISNTDVFFEAEKSSYRIGVQMRFGGSLADSKEHVSYLSMDSIPVVAKAIKSHIAAKQLDPSNVVINVSTDSSQMFTQLKTELSSYDVREFAYYNRGHTNHIVSTNRNKEMMKRAIGDEVVLSASDYLIFTCMSSFGENAYYLSDPIPYETVSPRMGCPKSYLAFEN